MDAMDFDKMFWSQLDPFYHLRHAIALLVSPDHFKQVFKESDGGTALAEELLHDYERSQNAAIRFVRYQAAETFLTIVLGTAPHGPVPRFAARFRNDRLNKLIEQIAEKRVPVGFEISKRETFHDWLFHKLLRGNRLDGQDSISNEISEFTAFQARFFNQRAVYNAFKHGCRVGTSIIPSISIQHSVTGELLPIAQIESGVAWQTWTEQKNSSIEVEIGAMECDHVDDMAAVFGMAMLVKTMKSIRTTSMGDVADVQLPHSIKSKLHMPTTLKMTIKF